MSIRRYPIVDIQNEGANKSFNGFPMRQVVGYDGQNLSALQADALAIKLTEAGDITYLAIAAPGTAQSDAKWQARKLDSSDGMVVTWADGDSEFDNVATDLTALSYS